MNTLLLSGTITLAFAAVLTAESGLGAPEIGFVRDGNNNLRRLVGVRGNLLLEGDLGDGVVSAAFSRGGGILKTGGELQVLTERGSLEERFAAPAGPVITGFSREGCPDLLYFPVEHAAWLRRGGQWNNLPLTFDGVVAGASLIGAPVFLVRREGQIWSVTVSAQTGMVLRETQLPGVAEPVLALSDRRILYMDGEEAALRSALGDEFRIRLPFPVRSLEPAGAGAVVLRGERRNLLLWVDGTAPRLDFLPEVTR